MVCLFKKTADVSVDDNLEGLSPGHRRLRFSFQINDFKDPDRRFPAPPFSARGRRRRRFSRLGFPCQAVLSEKNLFSAARPEASEARCLAPHFPASSGYFQKKNHSVQGRPGGRRRRLSSESRSPCQPGFSAISRIVKPEPPEPQKTVGSEAGGPSLNQSDDSIGARRLVGPACESKDFFVLVSTETGRFQEPPRPRGPARRRARRPYT